MTVALFTDPICVEHDPGEGHPEQPERLRSILRTLLQNPVAGTELMAPPEATLEELQRVHDARYVQEILALKGQTGSIDADTAVSAKSIDAALLAAGAAAQSVR